MNPSGQLNGYILAGGLGTRFQPLTLSLPKPLIPVLGKPSIEYSIEILERLGVKEVVVSTYHLSEKLMEHLGDGSRWKMKFHFLIEEEPRGTAGGLAEGFSLYSKPSTTVILSGDVITNADVQAAIDFHRHKKAIFTLGVLERNDVTGAGILSFDQNNKMVRFLEKPSNAEDIFSHWVNGSIYIAEPTVLQYLPTGQKSDFAHDLFPAMLKAKAAIFAYPLPEGRSYLMGIDSPELHKRVEDDILAGKVFHDKKI